MKRFLPILLSAVMLTSCCYIAGCSEHPVDPVDPVEPVEPVDPVDGVSLEEQMNFVFDNMYPKNEIVDNQNGFTFASDVTSAKFFVNGSYQDTITDFTTRKDAKLELYNENAARLVNVSSGFAYTLPSTEISVDYTIAQYRTQVSFDDSILTVSFESGNPYTSNSNPWYIYCGEWLIEHINSDDFISNNNLQRLNGTAAYEFTPSHAYGDLTVKEGFDVYRYDVLIADGEEIERPYYNIAIIRAVNDVKNFTLFVMKSFEDQSEIMDSIVQSYACFARKGMPRNYFDAGAPQENPNWSAETKAYYEQLCASDTVNWGVFSYSMPGGINELNPGDSSYDNFLSNSKRMQAAIEDGWNYKFDIYPTYTHIGSGTNADNFSGHYFPLAMAKELAGGNGVNGKPVLQFTYQFTLNNNNTDSNATPMFDILRGKFDGHFRRLAQDIKAYGKPVLFRLNNEMNTDWTSYCGMLSLLDPDIFNMTWQRLYNIFEEEGVDNAIWIWNPIADSCPYSSWGEDLCYFPGVEYVQLLGGTSYEMNNYEASAAASSVISFESHYSSLYEKNKAAFSQWSMILSEFACGSGGDYSGALGRNGGVQAQWVTDMFECLNAENAADWVKQIKGAVWFNCNDYVGTKITNRLRFIDPDSRSYDDLAPTVEAFRKGFEARTST